MPNVVLGVVVLNRVEKLRGLLDSARDAPINKVYIADNGRMSNEKESLYDTDFPFEIEVLDLEYDIGLGYSRNAIVEKFEEDYLLVADSDHQIGRGVNSLVSVLESRPDLGGVAGTIVEPDRGRIWQSAKDFRERGDKLVRSAHLREKNIDIVAEVPFVEFDFIPYPALYRKSCIQDYSWDPEYPLGRAHVDFYVGHWKNTDWKFGISPNIFFEHYPGGSSDYTDHRRNDEKYRKAKGHFRNKWGYSSVESASAYWFDTGHDSRTLLDRAYDTYQSQGVKATITSSFEWVADNIRLSNNSN